MKCTVMRLFGAGIISLVGQLNTACYSGLRAGIHFPITHLDSRLCGNDIEGDGVVCLIAGFLSP